MISEIKQSMREIANLRWQEELLIPPELLHAFAVLCIPVNKVCFFQEVIEKNRRNGDCDGALSGNVREKLLKCDAEFQAAFEEFLSVYQQTTEIDPLMKVAFDKLIKAYRRAYHEAN